MKHLHRSFAFALATSIFCQASPLAIAKDSTQQAAVIAPLAARSLLLDGHQSGKLLAVVGPHGHILTSLDKGHNWRQQAVPQRTMLTSAYLVSEQKAFAAGHDAAILRSKDGGKNWRQVYQDIEARQPILDLWFENPQHGIAVGAYGLLLRTEDGGDNWQDSLLSEDEDFHINAIGRLNEQHLFAVGEAGSIYLADPSGREWQRLESPYEGSLFGFQPLGGDSVLVYGLRGNMFRSDDLGKTWQQVKTQTKAMLTDSVQLADKRIVVSGLGGTVLISSDNGQTFTLLQQADRQGIESLMNTEDGLLSIGAAGIRRLDLDTQP